MSLNLSTAQVKLFEKEAIQAFQEMGTDLRNTVRVKDAKGANSVQFNVYGEVVAPERTSIHTPIPVQDPTVAIPTATVKRYAPSIMTDIFDNNEIGFDERQEAVKAISASMKRRLDQVVIDALDAHTFTNTIANNVSGSVDNLNTAHFAKMAELLGSSVPETDRFMLSHDAGYYHFIQESDVSSSDFNTRKPLTDGSMFNWVGMDIRKLGNRDGLVVGDGLGGLQKDGSNDRTGYFYHKSAIGLAMNMEPTIKIDWEPSYGAWRVTGFMSAGGVVIQDGGVGSYVAREA